MNATQERFEEGSEQFNEWLGRLLVIAGKVELEDACDLYSFSQAYDEKMTPQEAWDDYQEWINS